MMILKIWGHYLGPKGSGPGVSGVLWGQIRREVCAKQEFCGSGEKKYKLGPNSMTFDDF